MCDLSFGLGCPIKVRIRIRVRIRIQIGGLSCVLVVGLDSLFGALTVAGVAMGCIHIVLLLCVCAAVEFRC